MKMITKVDCFGRKPKDLSEDKKTLLEFQRLTTGDITVIHFHDSKPSAFSINESASSEEDDEKDKQEDVHSTSEALSSNGNS
ncbi:hypothetical protein TSPI_08103 [Trichinella spiralis]|uniref:Uncharacterized protein n=1 Tax=Trichinella spiralis TaxID=6334 RepID=A0ABR3K2U8_TRISP